MSIFLTEHELDVTRNSTYSGNYPNLFWGMVNRVQKYTEGPGLSNFETSCEWWHHAAEYLTEAAWVYKVKPSNTIKTWLRAATMEIVRRSDEEWIGPFFRDHNSQPPKGHLETAHLSIGVAVTLDLARDIFTSEEVAEIEAKLRSTAIPLCVNWIEENRHIANWRCILMAGATVAAAVIDDKPTLEQMRKEYELCLNAIQPDGSYAESLQYSNYCYFGLMMTYESLVRSQPQLMDTLSIEPYAKAVKWFVHSYFYNKPLSGWGAYPLPRSANFNDSAAIFGADPDLLMHISARVKDTMPTEAGLARWMFEQLYTEYPAQGPFDLNTFGFINRYSFLSMIFYPQAAPSISPTEADLPVFARYSNGNYLGRNSWENGKTILAFSGVSDPLYGPGHLHADLNSLILVHNKERLLVDPGHTCYRTFTHEYESSTKAHNTCTFKYDSKDQLGDIIKSSLIQQGTCKTRTVSDMRTVGEPVKRPGKALISARLDDVTVFGSDAGPAYTKPIEKFERFCIMCGEHALFIVDRIASSQPVITNWNWLLNNRDGNLEYKLIKPDKIVARRGNAGMKLFHFGEINSSGPFYGHMHDAYHPLPQKLGEGAAGSALQFKFTSLKPTNSITRVHGIALDSYGLVGHWHLKQESEQSFMIEGPGKCCNWHLIIDGDCFKVSETIEGRNYIINCLDGIKYL